MKRRTKEVEIHSVEVSTRAEALEKLRRSQIISRAWADTLPVGKRHRSAAAFILAALDGLARAVGSRRAATGMDPDYFSIDEDALQLAATLGKESAKLPLADALQYVTATFPLLLPEARRSKLGAYYTPQSLTRYLFDQAEVEKIDWATARVLDPACGGGAFLIEAICRLRAALEGCEPAFVLAQISTRVRGLEIDPHAAAVAQAAIDLLVGDLCSVARRPSPKLITVGDALEIEPEQTFDFVVGNPPYGRVRLNADQRRRFARSLYGHANLYGVFMDLALRWSKPGAVIAYLTPASFLSGQYYGALRQLLASQAPPLAMAFIHARKGIFTDVLQETMVAIYRRDGAGQRVKISHLHVMPDGNLSIKRNGTVSLPKVSSEPWLAPRDAGHAELIRFAEGLPSRLEDLGYRVSTGPLVWNRFKHQLRTKPGVSIYPLVWAESVSAAGEFRFQAKNRRHVPYFKIERGDEWLIVRNSCVLVQRTTAKEQAKRLIAAVLPEAFVAKTRGVVVENHLNMIIPATDACVSPAVLAALLNSKVVNELFRCMNGSVAVSAFELEALPIPGAPDLRGLGKLLDRNASPSAIERECARLYGQSI